MGCATTSGTYSQSCVLCGVSRSLPWTWKDGIEVVIRPISPGDEMLTIGFHGGLSDRTVYLRYFCSLSPAARTAHERLVHICFAYSERETVLVADHIDPQTRGQSIVPIGRLNKLPSKNEAQLAVLASDDYQGC